MPTSGQACNVQDQESELISFFSKPSSMLAIANDKPESNMGKIIWQTREKYKEEVKNKTVKELTKLSLEFCKELIKYCIPEFDCRIFSILKPSKSASYGLFLVYILQIDECELKWQVVLQPSLLWKFHGYLGKFLSRSLKHSNELEELFAPIRELFQLLVAPKEFNWSHPHIILEKIFSYYCAAFEPKNKAEGINYWFAKAAILLKIFTKITLRDLTTIKRVPFYLKPTFQSLEKGKWLNFKIPSYEIIKDVDPLTTTYKLLELRKRLGLRSNFILVYFDHIDRSFSRNYLREIVKKELGKMNLSISDLCNLPDNPNLLLEFRQGYKKYGC
jgi:hypothetical protein